METITNQTVELKTETTIASASATHVANTKSAKILAKSVFRDLRESGHSTEQVMEFAGEILNLLGQELGKPSQA